MSSSFNYSKYMESYPFVCNICNTNNCEGILWTVGRGDDKGKLKRICMDCIYESIIFKK